MQLNTKDGIRCDGCGLTIKDDFTYYSIDFKRAKSRYGQNLSLAELQLADTISSFDFCSRCIDKIFDKIVETNKNSSARKTGLRYCDFTGVDLMKSDDLYIYAEIIKVDVVQSTMPYVCEKCSTPINVTSSPCKCGHNKFERKANIITYPRMIEIFASSSVLTDFESRKHKILQEGGQWNATS